MKEIASGLPHNPTTVRLCDRLWFNALWFQSTWFCLVLGRDELLPVSAALILLHLTLVRNVWRELATLSTIAIIGIAIDAALSYTGFFRFPGDVLVPLWLCCLWLAFATTLTRSLSWLDSHKLLAVIAGAIAIPLNYWAGQRLGAVEFPQPLPLTLAVMSITWAIILPGVCRLASTLKLADDERINQ